MTRGLGLLLFAGYLVPAYRAYRGRLRRGDSAADARLYAVFCMLAKPAQALGAARYWIGRASDRRAGLDRVQVLNRTAADPFGSGARRAPRAVDIEDIE